MKFEWKVALRFLREGKTQTIFILFGIAVGVAVQIFLNALIGGLQKDLIQKTVGNSPHISIYGEKSDFREINKVESGAVIFGNIPLEKEKIRNWETVIQQLDYDGRLKTVSPVIEGNGYISQGGKISSLFLRGVVLLRADRIYNINREPFNGNMRLEGNQVLIGKELADSYRLQQGSIFTISLPNGVQQQFTVNGIFDLQNQAINSSWVFMDLVRAQKLFGENESISSIEIQVYEPFKADEISTILKRRIDWLKIKNWKEANAQLLKALQSQTSTSLTIQNFVHIAIK